MIRLSISSKVEALWLPTDINKAHYLIAQKLYESISVTSIWIANFDYLRLDSD